jgi:hypothetical protein
VHTISNGSISIRFSAHDGVKQNIDDARVLVEQVIKAFPDYKTTRWGEWSARLNELTAD